MAIFSARLKQGNDVIPIIRTACKKEFLGTIWTFPPSDIPALILQIDVQGKEIKTVSLENL